MTSGLVAEKSTVASEDSIAPGDRDHSGDAKPAAFVNAVAGTALADSAGILD